MYCPFLCSRVVSATLIADTLGLRLTYDVKGGGMLASASDQDTVKLGNNIILTGLFLQIMFFAIFVVVAGVFHKRMQAAPTVNAMASTLPWARYLWILYLASFLIIVRCVFRIAEYAGGQEGVLLSTEIYLYIFDATLMFLVMVVFNVQHPSLVISKRKVYDHRMEQLYTSEE
jgi:energy-converting hydrogenase Eha subunit H